MNVFLTLDYELYFGLQSGSVEHCIIRPTEALLKILDVHNAKATFFVDVGYLSRCRDLGCDQTNYARVVGQLTALRQEGHDLQLHIHPHWEDCQFYEGRWQMDTRRFKLHDFSREKATDIIRKYNRLLTGIRGSKPSAFRAGGWCLQPFDYISTALSDEGIRLDSTVFRDGVSFSETHAFDFRGAPKKPFWRFDNDPLIEATDGRFIELPIADVLVNPLFYWRFAAAKKLGGKGHRSFGDGKAAAAGSFVERLKMLVLPSVSVASVDGYKASLLGRARSRWERLHGKDAVFVLIGHPKAFTDYSLSKTARFMAACASGDHFLTIEHWLSKNLK
jgi:peptidoglycan/xylan/chitin deacetylase (PgdA/CDA1 family)